MRVKHGTQGSFSVGDDVPVLGAITYPSAGAPPVQSVEYKSSGVIFGITPSIHADSVDLVIDQQLSNFAPTTTGVNQSPTLTKRALKTQVSVQDGDLIVLGGLTQDKKNTTRDGLQFLPAWLHTTGEQTTTTEVLLVLQVQRL
jgi:type II secretory pathway component GspD/PulD (secretin)